MQTTLITGKKAISYRFIEMLLLIFVYLLAAGSSFSAFVAKYGFQDMPDSMAAVERYSLPRMLDQTADRPFVYRQLLPALARATEDLIPEKNRRAANEMVISKIRSNWSMDHAFSRSSAVNPNYSIKYLVVYVLTFASYLAGLFFLRKVCLHITSNQAASTLAPLVFAGIFPLLLSKNGYFYDFPELMFMALGAWLAIKNRWIWLAIVTGIATLNKETYFLFAFALMPFMLKARPNARDMAKAFVIVLPGIIINLVVKSHYSGNPGVPIELHLVENLHFYLSIKNYFHTAIMYGIVIPNGFNIISVVFVVYLLMRGWKHLPSSVKLNGIICAAINFPLFFVFCAPEELRNLSLLYLFFVLLIAANLRLWLTRTERPTLYPPGRSIQE